MKRLFSISVLILLCCLVADAQRSKVIAFTSDTQEPMWIETLFLKSNRNLEATRAIFKDVTALHPAALFILGDVVSLGMSSSAWTNIDAYMKTAAKDSIPVYATLGNHEVMFGTERGTKNFRERFPAYNPSGYSEMVDSVAVILLNSNFTKMTTTQIKQQDDWYSAYISKLDKDPAVKFIVVGCHHSPYTNSKIVKPSAAVQQKFVPAFIRSKKGVLFLSGHSHNFERFQVQGKWFLVIGGGGGLHQPLYADNETMHDLSATYKPAFHYLELIREQNKVKVISRQLKPDFSGFTDGLVFDVK